MVPTEGLKFYSFRSPQMSFNFSMMELFCHQNRRKLVKEVVVESVKYLLKLSILYDKMMSSC